MSEATIETGPDPSVATSHDSDLLGAQLYARLAELLAPAGTLDATTSAVLVEACGRDLDPADFGTDPEGAGAEAFADLVNVVPVPGPTFVDSSRRLDDVAGLVLLNAASDPGASTAAARLIEDARADLALMARGSETAGAVYHPAVADPKHWWDETTTWATASFTIGGAAPVPPPPPDVVVLPPPPLRWTLCPTGEALADPTVRLAATGQLSRTRLERLRGSVLDQLDLHQKRADDGTGSALARSARVTGLAGRGQLVTADVASDVAGSDPVRRPGWSPGIAMSPRLMDEMRAHQILVDQAPTQPVTPPPDGFALTFSYRVVTIDRPWWHSELFAQPGWTMPGFAPGAVSTGTATANPGLLGAVTTRMLLVRDLSVHGAWSDADAAAAAAAQHELGTLGLGPFSLTGEVGWDGTTLTRPGMQVVAWVAAITPEFPPRP